MTNTHHLVVQEGKYAGTAWTRVPIAWLKYQSNNGGSLSRLAKEELDRRGIKIDSNVDVTGHAVDRASLTCWKIYRETREPNEGLHSWLQRTAMVARLTSESVGGKIKHNDLIYVFREGEYFPVLVTIINPKEPQHETD